MTQTVFDNKTPLYVASIEPHFNLMYDRQEGHISTLSLSDLLSRSRSKDGLVKTSHEDRLVSTHIRARPLRLAKCKFSSFGVYNVVYKGRFCTNILVKSCLIKFRKNVSTAYFTNCKHPTHYISWFFNIQI